MEHRRAVTRDGASARDRSRYAAWELGFGIYNVTFPANHPDPMTPARYRACVEDALSSATGRAWVWAYITGSGNAYTFDNPWTNALKGIAR